MLLRSLWLDNKYLLVLGMSTLWVGLYVGFDYRRVWVNGVWRYFGLDWVL